MSVEGLLKSLKRLNFDHCDDYCDRMHYFITSNILVTVSTIAAWKVFESQAIQCMTPINFPKSWITVSKQKS